MERSQEEGALIAFKVLNGMKRYKRDQVAALIDHIPRSGPFFITYQGGGDDAYADDAQDKQQDAYPLDFHRISRSKWLVINDVRPDLRRQ
jgi:hypothetical protein